MKSAGADSAAAGEYDPARMVWVLVILAVVAVVLIVLVLLYNRFVRLRNRVDNAWAQIEVQLSDAGI